MAFLEAQIYEYVEILGVSSLLAVVLCLVSSRFSFILSYLQNIYSEYVHYHNIKTTER